MTIKPKSKLLLLIALAAILVSSGFRCTFIKSKQERQALQPVVLNYWRVWEGREELKDLLNTYQSLHPNISINIRKLRFEEFEKELLEAYAKDQAPDLISLHASWLERYINKGSITAMPMEITMAYQFQKKSLGIKDEIITEVRTNKSPTVGQIRERFIDTVAKDVISDNTVYGLPLSVDTMVLYYNRDLLNNAGFPTPPSDWTQFQEQVRELTYFDQERNIAIAGAALGTVNNIRRSPDILALLMMQNGTQIVNDQGGVVFHTIPAQFSDSDYHPGIEALRFYIDFSDPTKEVYSWNETKDDSLLEFARNNVAFYFGYSYDLPEILAISKGKINLGLAPIPQINTARPVNVANYWVETVSSKSKYKHEAWDFVLFATDEKNVKSFLSTAKRPTALRLIITEQIQDDTMRSFASQLLTSKTWYQGNDFNAAEEIMKDLMEAVSEGEDPKKAITFAASRMQNTLHAPRE